MLIQTKDVAFRSEDFIAIGSVPVAATMQTPEYFGISLWLRGVSEPIFITYNTAEERNDTYQDILNYVDVHGTTNG
jgi:hypothetical protein